MTKTRKLCRFGAAVASVALAAGTFIGQTGWAKESTPPHHGSNTGYTPQGTLADMPQVPEGYEEVYFASFVRHGSRTSSGSYHITGLRDDVLKDAKAQGAITPKGEELLKYLDEEMLPVHETIGNGNLTTTGKREMFDYGARLAERHEGLIGAASNTSTIRLESSAKWRAIESAEFIAGGMHGQNAKTKTMVPADPDENFYVLQHQDVNDDDWAIARNDYLNNDPDYLAVKDLPNNWGQTENVKYSKDALRDFVTDDYINANESWLFKNYCGGFARTVFETRSIAAGMMEDGLSAYPELSPAAEAAMENVDLCTTVDEWYKRSNGLAGQDVTYNDAKPLLNDFFDSIDNASETGEIGSVRASHNEILTPFNALLQIPGVRETTTPDKLFNFQDFEFRQAESDPMGGNIEWIVYEKENGNKIVLMLHNEKPATFGWSCQPITEGSLFYDYDHLKACLPDVGQDKTPTKQVRLTASTTNLKPGDQVTVVASGFNANETVNFSVDPAAFALPTKSVKANVNGTASLTFTIPSDLANGQYVVVAESTETELRDRVALTVAKVEKDPSEVKLPKTGC